MLRLRCWDDDRMCEAEAWTIDVEMADGETTRDALLAAASEFARHQTDRVGEIIDVRVRLPDDSLASIGVSVAPLPEGD